MTYTQWALSIGRGRSQCSPVHSVWVNMTRNSYVEWLYHLLFSKDGDTFKQRSGSQKKEFLFLILEVKLCFWCWSGVGEWKELTKVVRYCFSSLSGVCLGGVFCDEIAPTDVNTNSQKSQMEKLIIFDCDMCCEKCVLLFDVEQLEKIWKFIRTQNVILWLICLIFIY